MISDYVQGNSGVKPLASEKVKFTFLDKLMKLNPWLLHRLAPDQTEAFKTGGGVYRFQTLIGVALPIRQTADATSSGIDYDGKTELKEITLTIARPFETLAYPFKPSDALQMDGINYSPAMAGNITSSLVQGEINVDTATVMTVLNQRTKDLSAVPTVLETLKGIKALIGDYYDISATNTNWPVGVAPVRSAFDYFSAKVGSYEPSMIKIHMNPADAMNLSNLMTELGAGSDLQWKEFQDGNNKTGYILGGITVIQNRNVPISKMVIITDGMIGVPDSATQYLKVNQWYDNGNDVDVIRGWDYYDSVLPTPELITIITVGDLSTLPATV